MIISVCATLTAENRVLVPITLETEMLGLKFVFYLCVVVGVAREVTLE